MSLSDLLVIYSALGAPVAMYLLVRRRTSSVGSVARAFAELLLWPAALVYGGVKLSVRREETFLDDSTLSVERTNQLSDALLQLVKRDLRGREASRDVSDFREVLDRFVGLNRALDRAKATPALAESAFHLAAGHPNPQLAAACHRRNDMRKLSLHRDAAAEQFRKFFSDNPSVGLDTFELARSTSFAAGDVSTADFLDLLCGAAADDSQSTNYITRRLQHVKAA